MKFANTLLIVCFLIGLTSCQNKPTSPVSDNEAREATQEELPAARENNVSAIINVGESNVKWSCSKPGKTHNGHVKILNGSAILNANKLVGGSVILDMNSLAVDDLKGDSKRQLEEHLKGLDDSKSNDFFNVRQFPTSEFVISRVVQLNNDPEYNSLIYGNLSFKNVFKEIAFKANAKVEGGTLHLKSDEFSINRLEWGIIYNSKSLFKELKDKVIDDEVFISLEVKANTDL